MAEAPGPKILSGASVFLVEDVVKAANYYRDSLGFRYNRFWGEPPCFCMVWRNEQCVMLSQTDDPSLIRPVSRFSNAWDAYFWVDDVEAFYAEMKANGAKISDEPQVARYEVKEFTVKDLDGHLICFGQEV